MQLPTDFAEQMTALLGPDEFSALRLALLQPPPVSVRCRDEQPEAQRVPWCPTGRYLHERPAFTADPLLHAGRYYVQEASSMFLDHVLRTLLPTLAPAPGAGAPLAALDLCAAPGGKSTLLLQRLPAGSLLVANEPVRQRANILAENLTKWGAPGTIVTQNHAADFQRAGLSFDLVLCDAPCSGEGMFRKDPNAAGEWSAQAVRMCAERQRGIVRDIWPCLRPGGLLVYSTCTYNTRENEENTAWIARELGADILGVPLRPEWNVAGCLLPGHTFPAYRFLPHRTRGEGFYLSVLRKHGDAARPRPTRGRKERDSENATHKELSQWILHADDFTIAPSGGGTAFSAFPKAHADALRAAQRSLRVVHHGITLATALGNRSHGTAQLQPAHSLAMSDELNPGAFPAAELPLPQALAYLRAESIVLPPGAPRGYVVATYGGVPLGFVKNLGTRANNLYPQPWRIRSTHF